MRVVLGARVKTGWAAVVLLGIEGKAPQLLDSREIRLSDWDLPHGRQPFHATFGVEQTDRALIRGLVRGVERYSRAALRALLREYLKRGHRVRHAVIVVSSLTDPATIANQHMRAHASEGQLYRRVVEQGLGRSSVKTTVRLERDVRDAPAALRRRVVTLGKSAPRWRSEEKLAATAALMPRRHLPRQGVRA